MASRSAFDFTKLIVLKLTNVFVVYIVKHYIPSSADEEKCVGVTSEQCDCPLSDMGYQFVLFMVVDMTVSGLVVAGTVRRCRPLSPHDSRLRCRWQIGNVVEMLSSLMVWKCNRVYDRHARRSQRGDDELRVR